MNHLKYEERIQDIFTISNDYYIAHCISDDYALGAGIAFEISKRFQTKTKLILQRKQAPSFHKTNGHCIRIDRILNLVTKELCYHKPTYESLTTALQDMKRLCKEENIQKVAMPLIGCGIDKLEWEPVSKIIRETFKDMDMEIIVCKLK